jgi:hypothetical protein
MSANANDYRRDLEDIRDRLDYAGGAIDELEAINERLDKIEEYQGDLWHCLKDMVDHLKMVTELLRNKVFAEVLTTAPKGFAETFNQIFSKAAPAASTRAKRTKPRKPRLSVVPTDSTAKGSADDDGPGAA